MRSKDICSTSDDLQLLLSFALIIVQLTVKESIKISIFIIIIQLILLLYKFITNKIIINSIVCIYSIFCIVILYLSIFQANKEFFLGNFYSIGLGVVLLLINININVVSLNKKIFVALIIMAAIMNFEAINKFIELYFFKGYSNVDVYKNMFELQFGKSNALGLWFVALICMLLEYKEYIIARIFILLSVFSMLALVSKSTIVIFVLMLLIRNRNKIKFFKNVFFVLISTTFICVYNTNVIDSLLKILRINNAYNLNDLSSGRIEIYLSLIRNINLKTLFLGKGLGNIVYNNSNICAHNLFLQIILTTGLIGLTVFIILNYLIFYRLRKYRNIDIFRDDVFIIFLCAFLSAQVEPGFFTGSKISSFMWIIIGIALSKSIYKMSCLIKCKAVEGVE